VRALTDFSAYKYNFCLRRPESFKPHLSFPFVWLDNYKTPVISGEEKFSTSELGMQK